MSNVTTRRRASAAVQSRRRFQSVFALLAILVAGFGFAPAAANAEGISRAEACAAWTDVKGGADSLTLSTGIKVEADQLRAEGVDCNSTDAAIVAVAPTISEAPSGVAGTGAAQALASVLTAAGGGQLADGDEIFQGAYIAGFRFDLNIFTGKATISGRVIIDFSETRTELSFAGGFTDLNNYSINVFTPNNPATGLPTGTKLPGVGGDPLSFRGTFVKAGASSKLNIKASAPYVTIGQGAEQFSLRNGELALSLADETNGTGLKLDASGTLGIGDSLEVDGAITADFDETGLKSFTGSGGLTVTVPEGSVSGSAELSYTREPLARSITFTGGLTVGDAVVANASGTIDDAAVSFTGNVEVSNADLGVKGGVDGIVYYGDNLTGRTISNYAGAQVPAQKGDVLLKAATGEITWKSLTLKGGVQYGDVGDQTWAKANGSVGLSFQSGDQPPTTITGGAGLAWLKGSSPAVSFEGSITSGSTEVASAKGTIDAAKITFEGQVTLANPDLKITGAVSGVVFYGSDLAGETIKNAAGALVPASKGDFALTSASASIEARGFMVSGNVGIGRVGGERWATGGGAVSLTYGATTVKGSAQVTWVAGQLPGVTFEGEIASGLNKVAAKGTIDGKKLLFEGSLSSPTASGSAKGGVYYGADLAGETIVNKSGATVAAKAGDFYLSGDGSVKLKQVEASATFTLKKVGTVTWLSTNAQVKVAGTFLAFAGDVDSLGNFSLKGAGSVDFDGTTVLFSGTASSVNGKLVISGSGTVKTGLFSATISGTIEKPDAASSVYVLTGSASFKFGTFQVAGATVRLTIGEGLTTTFGIKACFLFICPNATYKLYFRGGNVSRAELNAPIAWAPKFLAIGVVVLGPSVPISTKITGIF
ncbi:MAG: hypothetical protein JHD16_07340 [Solirubrobacteraceae bacterium]|nr:hypothetical protein [Solirubrobacteraceae bacterium]